MKCPKCESDNREGVKFCEECGAKLELQCPACKAKIPLWLQFFRSEPISNGRLFEVPKKSNLLN